jgi:hypothetical protein
MASVKKCAWRHGITLMTNDERTASAHLGHLRICWHFRAIRPCYSQATVRLGTAKRGWTSGCINGCNIVLTAERSWMPVFTRSTRHRYSFPGARSLPGSVSQSVVRCSAPQRQVGPSAACCDSRMAGKPNSRAEPHGQSRVPLMHIGPSSAKSARANT